MHDAAVIERIRRKFQALTVFMDERMRRHWAAAEAKELAWGGTAAVAQATGLSRTTILSGIRDLESLADSPEASPRIRRPGGGRKLLVETDPELFDALDALVDPVTRGHPESPLRWTCKSTRQLAAELTRQGHPVSDRTVASLLIAAGYSLQANREPRFEPRPGWPRAAPCAAPNVLVKGQPGAFVQVDVEFVSHRRYLPRVTIHRVAA